VGYRYPDPGLEKGIALGVISALAAYYVASKVKKIGTKELKPEESAALGAGFIGFLVGLLF
jgi:uncharacterized membrane protein YfcA